MVRVGIVGCGKIADQHAMAIQRITNATIVGVCDQEELMARQLYERFEVPWYGTELEDLLNTVHPDVVHITTPPQSHFEIAKKCLEAGVHVYVEKPFTVNRGEAKDLIQLAEERKLKITVGHNLQFTKAAIRARELVASGYLGGNPTHIESYYCYDLRDQQYAKAFLSDKEHWVRKLPGGLLQNLISHGISRIAEFLSGETAKVIACGFTSPLLKSLGENKIVDELRVIVQDDKGTTGYFTFSSQWGVILHQLRLFGPKNAIIVDDDYETVVKVNGKLYKSYLQQFVPPFTLGLQYMGNTFKNIKNFIKRDLYQDSGLKCLIEKYYESIESNKPVPIPYREILLTSLIMDEIFSQLKSRMNEMA